MRSGYASAKGMKAKRLPFTACAALVMFFGACSLLATLRLSPTIDEPICELAAYLHVHDGDFTFDADNPPLWKLWAFIPNLERTLCP